MVVLHRGDLGHLLVDNRRVHEQLGGAARALRAFQQHRAQPEQARTRPLDRVEDLGAMGRPCRGLTEVAMHVGAAVEPRRPLQEFEAATHGLKEDDAIDDAPLVGGQVERRWPHRRHFARVPKVVVVVRALACDRERDRERVAASARRGRRAADS